MRILSLFAAIILGAVFPQGHVWAFLIRYALMIMLFFAFLDINIKRSVLKVSHLWILLANGLIAAGSYGVVYLFSPQLAPTAFITGIMPTAVAATVIIGFLRGETSYVVFAVLLTNVAVALLLPFILPFIIVTDTPVQTLDIVIPVFTVILLPLFIALISRRMFPVLVDKLIPFRPYTFYLFAANVYLATARASQFIRYDLESGWEIVGMIALLTFGIFVLNFLIGNWIGFPSQRYEGQQALGRKNTMFGIWVALTFIGPLAALGPVTYILFQNIFNSYQMWKVK